MERTKILYIRVSSKGQSISRQLETEQGIEHKFIDRMSGATFERPAFKEMMRFIDEVGGNSVHLFVHEVERFGRNLIEGLIAANEIKEKGAVITFVKDGMTISNMAEHASNDLIFNIKLSVAQDHRRYIRRTQKEGMEAFLEENPDFHKEKTGRKPSLKESDVRYILERFEAKHPPSPTALAQQMKISRMTVYRILSLNKGRKSTDAVVFSSLREQGRGTTEPEARAIKEASIL